MTRPGSWALLALFAALPLSAARVSRSGSDYGLPGAGPLGDCSSPSSGGVFGTLTVSCGTSFPNNSRASDFLFTFTLAAGSDVAVNTATFSFPSDLPQDFALVECPVDANVPCTPNNGPGSVQLLTNSLVITGGLATLNFANFQLPNATATVAFVFPSADDPSAWVASIEGVGLSPAATTTPEPNALCLIGGGLGAILGLRSGRRRSDGR